MAGALAGLLRGVVLVLGFHPLFHLTFHQVVAHQPDIQNFNSAVSWDAQYFRINSTNSK